MSERFDTFGYAGSRADREPWAPPAEPTDADDGGELDPREAAALLDQATRHAERQFDRRPPILTATAALMVLIAYGAVWLSVRHQHPYSGPTTAGLAVLYATLAVWIVFVVILQRRAVSGRSSRQRRLEAITFAAVWICVYIFQAALHHVDPNPAIAYGIYPAVAPLIVIGGAAAGYEAARNNPAQAGFAAAAVLLGAVASFAGPANVWGVVGLGLSIMLLIGTAAQVWQRKV